MAQVESRVAGPPARKDWAALPLWAATDPVDPLRDYSIPIHPHQRDDYQDNRRRRRRERETPTPNPQPSPDVPRDDGHIDDYA
jgi:hypothetical protein